MSHKFALPLEYEITAPPGAHEGSGHVYIVDATGKKLASLWGSAEAKMALCQIILDAANGTAVTLDPAEVAKKITESLK